MKQKKHIDRLFSERFKDFEMTPPDSVWQNIEARLQSEKKKRRVIPLFWYKTAGVAALLLLFFSIGNYFYNLNSNSGQTIVHEEQITNDQNNQSGSLATDNETETSSQEGIVYKDNTTVERNTNSNNSVTSEGNKITSEKSSLKSQQVAVKKYENTTSQKSFDKVLAENKKQEKISDKNQKQNISDEFVITETKIAEADKKSIDAEDGKSLINIQENEVIAEADTQKETEVQNNKKSLQEYLAEKELQKEEELFADNGVKNRWDVSPNVIPLYYNSFGKGSSIDAQFDNNPKKGDVNLGYGIQVSYALNNKLSIRTGINKIDLSYVTEGIEFISAFPEYGLSSIDYGTGNYIIAVGDQGSLNLVAETTLTNNGDIIIPRNGGPLPGSMRQNIDYLEIPLELKYSIVNKRIGVNIIGGVSTLVLNNNEVSIISGDFKTVIGEANNLNDLSFSTNIGVGLDYNLSRRLLFKLEPMLKYQLNPYTGNSSFKPYYLGVYSGFSYRF